MTERKRRRSPPRAIVLTRQQAEQLLQGELDEDLQVIRAVLTQQIRTLRRARGISQAELARRIGSSQPRIAMIEAGEPATVDLLLKCLRAVDASWGEVASMITSAGE